MVAADDSEAVEGKAEVVVDDVDDEGGPFFSPRASCPSGRDCNCVVDE